MRIFLQMHQELLLFTVILAGTRTKHLSSHKYLLISLWTQSNRWYLSSGPLKVTASQICNRLTYFENSPNKKSTPATSCSHDKDIPHHGWWNPLTPSLAWRQFITPEACPTLSSKQTNCSWSDKCNFFSWFLFPYPSKNVFTFLK